MSRVERFLTGILMVAALVTATATARSAFHNRQTARGDEPEKVDAGQWGAMIALGRPITDTAGPVSVVIFSDFQCPACRAFHRTMKKVAAEYPGTFTIRLIHYPLSYHPFAVPAATLAECVGRVGLFSKIADALFDAQDSLGTLSWEEIASRTGGVDVETAQRCDPDRGEADHSAITPGLRLGEEVGLRGTPMVVVNEMKYDVPPNEQTLRDIAAAAPRRR